MTIDYYTSTGGRTVNEDSLFAVGEDKDCLLIVADGLGGHGGGDLASQAAVKRISTLFKKCNLADEDLINAIIDASDEIVASYPKSRTTVAVLLKQGKDTYAAHVGDSRIYQFRNGSIVFQSRDHSICQMYVMTGEISYEQIRGHAERNKILRALGGNEQPRIDLAELEVRKGDAFLLCSDGFWENIVEEEMIEKLKNSHTAHEWLVQMRETVNTRLNSQSDNNSAVTMLYD